MKNLLKFILALAVAPLAFGQATTGIAKLNLTQTLTATGELIPAQITSTQNDYAPSGGTGTVTTFATAFTVRINSDAARSITGLAGGAVGRVVVLENNGTFVITLNAENASSTAANRFGFPGDLAIAAKGSVLLIYDTTASRWRGIGLSGTVSSVAASVPTGFSIAGSPITSTGTLAITYSGTAIPVVNGGTGLTTFTQGDIPYASAANTLSALADVGVGAVLKSGGIGTAPAWSATVAVTGGVTSSSASAGVGYATGSGGAATQGTSRVTGVTINAPTGAITLFSAAGTATPQTFTVTDSACAALDTVIVSQTSGTDLNEIFVTNVAAGSFKITFFTTGGTTTEQPVFHFAIIKGVSS